MNAIFCKNVALLFKKNVLYIFLERRVHKVQRRAEDILTIFGMMAFLTIDFSGLLGTNHAY